MSLPPKSRALESRPRYRLREGLWLVSAIVLLLLIGGTIAPEVWRQRVISKLRRTWSRESITQPVSTDGVESSKEGIKTPVSDKANELPSATPAAGEQKTARGSKGDGIKANSKAKVALPSILSLSHSRTDPDVQILQLTADAVYSPVYELKGGETKVWTPKRWIQVSVKFSSRRNLERLAILYEIDGSSDSFADAVAYENVPAGDSLVASVYLIPSRARSVAGREIDSASAGFRAALVERGSVLAVAEHRQAAPKTRERESGFLHPRSLTPFAPLDWEAFLPDAGFADEADFGPLLNGQSLTKTSPGR